MSNAKGPATGAAADQEMRRLTRRSLITGGVAALTGLGAWRWLTTATAEDGVPWPLRRALRLNQGVAEALGAPHQVAPTFSVESVRNAARTNGVVGLVNEVKAIDWRLRVEQDGRG